MTCPEVCPPIDDDNPPPRPTPPFLASLHPSFSPPCSASVVVMQRYSVILWSYIFITERERESVCGCVCVCVHVQVHSEVQFST